MGKISRDQEKREREYARNTITKITDEICNKYGYKYNKIYIKNQKTRLGSCSSKKNLNFNWQITKFPDHIRDYVIKHEIVHLKHLNHGKLFWKETEILDPNYKEHHKWIRKNAYEYLSF